VALDIDRLRLFFDDLDRVVVVTTQDARSSGAVTADR
jgi:hypothetical protein